MIMFHWLTERRRKHLLETPFPAEWLAICEQNVAIYDLLDETEQQRLRDLTQVFIAEKHWEGCGGLELDDEMRVTIAGTGCQMLLGRDHDLFSRLSSILVYPSTVVIPPRQVGVFTFPIGPVGETAVLGEATRVGAVVLAWDNAKAGARDARDGRNTVIHELAHQIDMISGDANGTPPMDPPHARNWGQVFEAAFLAHKSRAEHHQKSLLRDYAITNEAEYFAVAAEVFFEKPKQFLATLPDVYTAMAEFFGLDLAARAPRAAASSAEKPK
jgi:Mlc titration factor MtfA (ptsG expression regulator)